MKTSDSDLKVNRTIYPEVVTCDRVRLIGPRCDQLGPINDCWGQLDASYYMSPHLDIYFG